LNSNKKKLETYSAFSGKIFIHEKVKEFEATVFFIAFQNICSSICFGDKCY